MQAASQMGDTGFKSRITHRTGTDGGHTNPISIDDLTLSQSNETNTLKHHLLQNNNNLVS